MYGSYIRRLVPTQPPLTPTASETLAASPHAATSALSARHPGGLGRGLAGILDRSGAHLPRTTRPGLQQLLGPDVTVTQPRVRKFVTDTALSVIAEGFGAEAVAIARLDETGQPVVSSRLPPSWEESSSMTFELYGQLWGLLEQGGAPDRAHEAGQSRRPRGPRAISTHREIRLGQLPTWIGWQATASGELAAAVVRGESFSPAEQETLARLIRSVAVAIGTTRSSLPSDAGVTATTQHRDGRWRAEAIVDARGKRRRAFAEADGRELAIAKAAAKLCRIPVEVSFAGRTEVDGTAVTIVVVTDSCDAPFLGLAVTDPEEATGAVQAVFSAVGAMRAPNHERPAEVSRRARSLASE